MLISQPHTRASFFGEFFIAKYSDCASGSRKLALRCLFRSLVKTIAKANRSANEHCDGQSDAKIASVCFSCSLGAKVFKNIRESVFERRLADGRMPISRDVNT